MLSCNTVAILETRSNYSIVYCEIKVARFKKIRIRTFISIISFNYNCAYLVFITLSKFSNW